MTIHLELPYVPWTCWLWTYLLLCYLLLGPLISRTYYARNKNVPVTCFNYAEDDAVALWLFSPIMVPVLLIRIPCRWLIFGGQK